MPAFAGMTVRFFGQLDRDPAARLDRLAQQLVARRLFGALCNGGVAMGGFIGAEIFHRRFQRRILVFQRRDLRGVMLVDHFFHGGGAGKGGFLAHRGGGRAQRKTGDAPHRLQRGGPHLAFIHQLVEGLQMALFLLGHVA